jgi:KUP system potassium uptake protein
VVIGVLGLMGVVRNPEVLAAINPWCAISFLAHSGATGPLILGGVFLCVTGGEALYADMGHFGRGPIRFSWYAICLPALLLSYAGQTGLLLRKGVIEGNPFFQLAPSWAVYPLVVLATIATVIASQAIITGSFSMTRQAMQLGWLPSFGIRQTSDKIYGQIYVPVVNWMMMAATIGITIAFKTSDHLAGAYGTAVSTTMLLTTGLLFTAMRKVWRWSLLVSILVAGLFLIVDVSFFCANLIKIADGGWMPLTVGALVFFAMITWRTGVVSVRESLAAAAEQPALFVADLAAGRIPRVPGTAVFLSRTDHNIPPLIMDHVKHMGALHKSVIALNVQFEETPRAPEAERGSVVQIAPGVWRVTIRFGFIEIPDLGLALRQVQGLDPSIDLDNAIYFATRDLVVSKPGSPRYPHWRTPIFAFMFRNAVKVVDRFSLPSDRVVEIARPVEI